jgi:hypothetical protein
MPACKNPVPSNLYREFVIQMQRRHRCPPDVGETLYSGSIQTPSEMIAPGLVLNGGTVSRIQPRNLRALVPVTQPAGQPKIRFVITSSAAARDDVLYLKRAHHIRLSAQAVAASETSGLPDSIADIVAGVIWSHDCSGGRKPR